MENSQDFNMIFIFIAITVVSLFFTGLYFILRSYSSKMEKDLNKTLKSEEDAVSQQSDLSSGKSTSKPPVSQTLNTKSDVNFVSLKEALSKTRKGFWGHLNFSKEQGLDQHLESIEEALYLGDVGPQTVSTLVSKAQKHFKDHKLTEDSLKEFLKKEMSLILNFKTTDPSVYNQLLDTKTDDSKLIVLLVVGVNGAGKTTTLGKLAQNLASEGKKVLIAAGDTFRAAAGEQLKVWTERAQAEIYFPEGIKDPSAVAFDAVHKALSQGFDVCLIDTAGRLPTQDNLMAELEKVKRVVSKVIPSAPHHIWIVLDASSGQNALLQAKSFHQRLGLTGVVLTKLDGTAKGGMALAVANELSVPIRFIGVGERAQDLRPFLKEEFVDSLI